MYNWDSHCFTANSANTYKSMKMFVILLLISLCSCSTSTNSISIHRDMKSDFDSLVVDLQFNHIATIEPRKFGADTIVFFDPSKVESGHDILFSASLYKGAVKIDSFISFNDLGVIPNKLDITIDDKNRLSVKEY